MDRTRVRDEYRAMIDGSTLSRSQATRLTDDQMLEAARLVVVGQLAGDVAHELNNPLFAVLGLVELLLNDAEPGSKLAQRLGMIQNTGLEMKVIVRSLLDFARDRSNADAAELTLHEIATRAAGVAGRASSAKDVDVVVDADAGSPSIPGNASRVVPIIVDLITKATRALPYGGTVTISFDSDGSTATAHVAATGEQLEPPALDTGLGLSVVRAATEACGGTLTHSGGTTFSLRLPLQHVERIAA
jgi:signal transduction histidine kinase